MHLSTLLSISLIPHSSLHLSNHVLSLSFSVSSCISLSLSFSMYSLSLTWSRPLWAFVFLLFPVSFFPLHFQSIYIILYLSSTHYLSIYPPMYVLSLFLHPAIHTPIHGFYIPISFYESVKYFLFFFPFVSLLLSLFFYSLTLISLSPSSPSLSSFNVFFSSRYFRHSLNPCPRSRNASIPCVKGTCFAKAVKHLPMTQLKVNPVATWWKTTY